MGMHKQSPEPIGFVFINGAGLDGRIWRKVIEGLDQPCLLIELPLRNGSVQARSSLSLEDYVTHVRKQTDEWKPRRIVIVAHSLGGVLALGLAAGLGDRLAGIVAVGAVIPKDGGSFMSVLPFPKRMLMSGILRTIGTRPPAAAIRTGLCNGLSPDQTTEIVQGFIPESVRVYTDRINVSVPDVPKLYVRLTKDQEIGPSLQDQMIANLAPHAVHSLDTGHLPMISQPEGLRSMLEAFLSKLPNLHD